MAFAQAIKELQWPAEYAEGKNSKSLFEDVLTIEDVVKKFEDSGVELNRKQIDQQLSNVLIGSSGTTCVVATLPTREPKSRAYAIEQLSRAAESINGLEADSLRMFGGPVYTAKVGRFWPTDSQAFYAIFNWDLGPLRLVLPEAIDANAGCVSQHTRDDLCRADFLIPVGCKDGSFVDVDSRILVHHGYFGGHALC